MFEGYKSKEINEIANTILRVRKKILKKGVMVFKGQIIAYVGHDQYGALMSINRGDVDGVKNKIFLGAKIVEVVEDSYLHVTGRSQY